HPAPRRTGRAPSAPGSGARWRSGWQPGPARSWRALVAAVAGGGNQLLQGEVAVVRVIVALLPVVPEAVGHVEDPGRRIDRDLADRAQPAVLLPPGLAEQLAVGDRIGKGGVALLVGEEGVEGDAELGADLDLAGAVAHQLDYPLTHGGVVLGGPSALAFPRIAHRSTRLCRGLALFRGTVSHSAVPFSG